MQNVNKNIFIKSTFWKMMESLSTKGVSMIVSIILARILLPSDYGVVALTTIFINFSTLIVQSGLGTILIRNKTIDSLDYSNALFISFFVAIVCYTAFFFLSPSIAFFYNEPLLKPVLRVQMISLFIVSLSTVRYALVVKQFRFKALCIANFTANVISGTAGIIMALNGLGVWSLVFHTLIRDSLSTIILFAFVKSEFVFKVSFQRMKSIFSMSIWVLFASFLDFIGNNVYSAIFGKEYSIADVGFYNKGNQLPELVCLHTFGAMTSVLLPAMSEKQDEQAKLKHLTRKTTTISSYVIFPMMAGLAAVGPRLIPVLFTEKWTSCVPILWASCIYYAFNIFRSINMQLVYAKGKMKWAFSIELLRSFLMIVVALIGIRVLKFTIYTTAFLWAATNGILVLVSQMFSYKLIGYTYYEWCSDLMPNLLVSSAMFVSVYFLGRLPINSIAVILIQVLTGVVVYVGFSYLFKIESFFEVQSIIKPYIFRKKND